MAYDITVLAHGYELHHIATGETLEVSSIYFNTPTAKFPFTLEPSQLGTLVLGENTEYSISITSEALATQQLINSIKITPEGKTSDVLILSLDATNKSKAQAILNTLIEVYTQDGILDRQEVSKRTITFIDERFQFLTTELDSIEVAKGSYKQSNNLSLFQADAASVLQKREVKDEQLFAVETQLLLAEVLEKSMSSSDDFQLLPANIGLTSGAVNGLVSDYNTTLLEYHKWKTGAGENNPKIKILKQTILDLNANIQNSLEGYKSQLAASLKQNKKAQDLVQNTFRTLPSKEKMLRSIDREQLLKENLYLLLLQKREEAAITMAITSANVKVIDYAITNAIPVAPKRKIIVLGALLMGILIPVGFLYVKFLLNTKIYNTKDVETLNPEALILAEIPEITNHKKEGVSNLQNSQAVEAFRTLAHNLNFMNINSVQDTASVIMVTSSVKGEGKTTVSFNVAQTYFQLKNNVLLIGADLRNPQLHPYIDKPKNTLGFSNYLSSQDSNWEDLVLNIDQDSKRFDILLSGEIPPMPSVLLSSQRFKDFLIEARKKYDYIIIDTAPTLLVADTLTFIKQSDFTLYVVRSGATDKQLVAYSKKLVEQNKIGQMGYVINDVDFNRSYGYSYNYGYGYGYHADMNKKAWYQFWK